MTYAFTSESGAERFVEMLADELCIDTEILSFLHVEIDDAELPSDPEVYGRIEALAEQCGADGVLL
jgi:hypothetical protein